MHHAQVLSIDFCMLFASCSHVILQAIEMTHQCTRITWANLINVCLITSIARASRQSLMQSLLKSFVKHIHTFINGINDNLMDNSIIAMSSMEPRKRIITLHNNYCLTSYSIICKHITWLQKYCNCYKPDVTCVTIIL